MHGRNFTRGVTLTMFRMYGGEMTADNSANIVLDMEGCYPGTGCSSGQGGATFSCYGTYFAQSGGWEQTVSLCPRRLALSAASFSVQSRPLRVLLSVCSGAYALRCRGSGRTAPGRHRVPLGEHGHVRGCGTRSGCGPGHL